MSKKIGKNAGNNAVGGAIKCAAKMRRPLILDRRPFAFAQVFFGGVVIAR
ncbi:hypothetical protein WJ972_14720 [Achromobacter insuavis]